MRLRAVLMLLVVTEPPRPHLLLPLRYLLPVTLTRRRRRLAQVSAAAWHLGLLLQLGAGIRRRRASSTRARRVARALCPRMDAVEVIPTAASTAKGVPLLVLLVHPLLLRPVMRRGKARCGQRLSESTLNAASSDLALTGRKIPLSAYASGTGTSALVIQLARRGLHA